MTLKIDDVEVKVPEGTKLNAAKWKLDWYDSVKPISDKTWGDNNGNTEFKNYSDYITFIDIADDLVHAQHKCFGPNCGEPGCVMCLPCKNTYCKSCKELKDANDSWYQSMEPFVIAKDSKGNTALKGSKYMKYNSYLPKLPSAIKSEEKIQNTDMTTKSLEKIQSAKAKSIYAIANLKGSWNKLVVSPYSAIPLDDLTLFPTLNTEEQVKQVIGTGKNKLFARPCPLNPVHGFVDSRPISTYNAFKALVDEVNAKRGDDILEILLMPVINADYSAIVTPNSVTIGEGHDGATAGKRSIVINTPHPITEYIVKSSICKKFTKEGEVPFIEIVYGNLGNQPSYIKCPWVVQVRSGNQPDGFSADYVPYDVVVKRVHKVTAETDLLEWKTTVEQFTEGDVIYAASMSCHGAVHGVANKIPVLTSRVPSVGEELKAGFIAPVNAERVATLLKNLLKSKDEVDYNKIIFGWKFAHTLAVNNKAGGEEVLAYSLYNLIMGGLAACMGEYRHARGKKLKGFNKGKGRSTIFKETFEDKKRAFSIIHKVLHAFLSPRFSSGFGGKAWAECAQATIELQRAVVEIINNPCEESINKAIGLANDLAHAQHNGGILFNKFGSTNESIHDLLNMNAVIESLLGLSKVEKATINKTLLTTMNKAYPVVVKQLWEKWEITKKKQAEKEKKAFEKAKKQQALLKKKLEKEKEQKKQLMKKYEGLNFADKLLLPETKFQIRLLDDSYPENKMYRLQIKVLNSFIEVSVNLKDDVDLKLPKGTKKSWAGTSAKYVGAKLVTLISCDEKNSYSLVLKLTGGMEVATDSVIIHDSTLNF